MFTVGHLALGYLTGKVSARFLRVNINIPVILTLSIIPDIDLMIPMLKHGGPTHSIILYVIIALPIFLLWKKRALPYLVALVSHPILGDYPTRPSKVPGIQLFFPLSSGWFSAGSEVTRLVYVSLELALFFAFLALMFTTRDVAGLLTHHPSNMLLALPISTSLLSVFLQFPVPVPIELIAPHLILIFLLALAIFIDLKHILRLHHRL